MNQLVIIGASGFGREVAWLVERINAVTPVWNFLGFMDDDKDLSGNEVGGYPVLGTCEKMIDYPDVWYVCAIGSASTRQKVIKKVKNILPNVKFATLVDPSVLISERVNIGEGTIICAGTIITTDISIGKHVIINLDCTIGHDAIISDFVTCYPSANMSGITKIGEASEIGTGAHIIQMKSIGYNTIVGAGAVVVKDIPDNCTAVGNPARPIKIRK